MDPLSVIASITGILTAAFKISNAASAIISGWKDAPNSLHSIVSEMAALRACLAQLMPFLSRRETAPKSRMAAISVEQIVIVASSCVLAVSELQKTLDSLEPDKPLSKTVKLRWSSHEKKINMLRSRVQASANSLSLVLTALTCSTVEESHLSVCRLERTLFEILQKDPELAHRISNIPNCDSSHYASSNNPSALDISESAELPVGQDGITTNNPSALDISESAELPVGQDGITTSRKSSSGIPGTPSFGLDDAVERSLASSFVYLRADGRMLTSALTSSSSEGSGCGWSFFSEVSLAEVSNLSVLSLPVSWHELWRPAQYKPLNEPEISAYVNEDRDWKRQHINSRTLQTFQSNAWVHPTPFKPPIPRKRVHRSKADAGVKPTPMSPPPSYKSRSEAARARDVIDGIDHYLNCEQARSNEPIKILLLGGTETGKSTLLKMMHLLWAEGFEAEERLHFRSVIQSNIAVAFKMLLEHFHELGLSFHNSQSPRNEDIIKQIKAPIETMQQGLDYVRAWESLVGEDGIKKSYKHALLDNFARFSGDLVRLLSPDLVPTDADILHARLHTRRTTVTYLDTDTNMFRIFDFDGTRHGRKEWVHSFGGNNCLIFVAPLSGYNRFLVEDQTSSQLDEALKLFESLLAMTWFKRSPIYLILNKMDLLLEQIESCPITKQWPEYEGSLDDSENVITFIKNKFLKLADMVGRSVKVYPCNLTDIDSARIILDDLKIQPWERYRQTK